MVSALFRGESLAFFVGHFGFEHWVTLWRPTMSATFITRAGFNFFVICNFRRYSHALAEKKLNASWKEPHRASFVVASCGRSNSLQAFVAVAAARRVGARARLTNSTPDAAVGRADGEPAAAPLAPRT